MNILSRIKHKGTFTFPIAGSETQEHFDKTSVFTGDFTSPALTKLIFSKPRKYKFFIGLFHADGYQLDETEHIINEYLTKDELTQVIKQMCAELIIEYKDEYLDLTKSYIRIQL